MSVLILEIAAIELEISDRGRNFLINSTNVSVMNTMLSLMHPSGDKVSPGKQ